MLFFFFPAANYPGAVIASICRGSKLHSLSSVRAALSVQCNKSRGHGAAVGCWRLAHSAGGGKRRWLSSSSDIYVRPARAAPCLQSVAGVPCQPARALGSSQTQPPLRKATRLYRQGYKTSLSFNWPVGVFCKLRYVTVTITRCCV